MELFILSFMILTSFNHLSNWRENTKINSEFKIQCFYDFVSVIIFWTSVQGWVDTRVRRLSESLSEVFGHTTYHIPFLSPSMCVIEYGSDFGISRFERLEIFYQSFAVLKWGKFKWTRGVSSCWRHLFSQRNRRFHPWRLWPQDSWASLEKDMIHVKRSTF